LKQKQAKQCLALAAQTKKGFSATRNVNALSITVNNLHQIAQYSNWHIRKALPPFIQIFAYNQIFTKVDFSTFYEIVITLLVDQQIEVRQFAAISLSSLLRNVAVDTLNKLFQRFNQLAGKPLKRGKATQLTPEQLSKRHGGILGLSALINLSPYDVPTWLPPIVQHFVAFTNDPQPIAETVEKTIKNFWRTHQDTWHIEKSKFTEEQLEALSTIQVSTTYYA